MIGQDAELQTADLLDLLLDVLDFLACHVLALSAGPIGLLDEVLNLLDFRRLIIGSDEIFQRPLFLVRGLDGRIDHFLDFGLQLVQLTDRNTIDPLVFLFLVLLFVFLVVLLDFLELGVLHLERVNELGPLAFGDSLVNLRLERVGLTAANIQFLVAELILEMLLHKLKDFLPGLLGLLRLESAAGGQNDLDAHVADRPDGHVVKIGRVDAPFQGGGKLLGVEILRLAVGIDFVNENRSTHQVHAELEAALAGVVARHGLANDHG